MKDISLKETKEDSNFLTTFGNNCIQNKSIIIKKELELTSSDKDFDFYGIGGHIYDIPCILTQNFNNFEDIDDLSQFNFNSYFENQNEKNNKESKNKTDKNILYDNLVNKIKTDNEINKKIFLLKNNNNSNQSISKLGKKRKNSLNKNNEIRNKNILFTTEDENKLKMGNNIIKKSKRDDNQLKMIARNLIQNIFLNWINYEESNKDKKLYKLNPIIFHTSYIFKKKKLKEIYSEEISLRVKNQNHNIKTNINAINCSKGIKNIKLNFTFEQAFKLFYNKNEKINEKEWFEIIQIPKEEKDVNFGIKDLLKGLKGKEEYLFKKGGNSTYKKKLIANLDKFKKIYVD